MPRPIPDFHFPLHAKPGHKGRQQRKGASWPSLFHLRRDRHLSGLRRSPLLGSDHHRAGHQRHLPPVRTRRDRHGRGRDRARDRHGAASSATIALCKTGQIVLEAGGVRGFDRRVRRRGRNARHASTERAAMAKGQMRSNKEKKKPKQDKDKKQKGAPRRRRSPPHPAARSKSRPAPSPSLSGRRRRVPCLGAPRRPASARLPGAAREHPGEAHQQRRLVGEEVQRAPCGSCRTPRRSAARPAPRRCRGRAGAGALPACRPCAACGRARSAGRSRPCRCRRGTARASRASSPRPGASSGRVRSTPAWTKKRSPSS